MAFDKNNNNFAKYGKKPVGKYKGKEVTYSEKSNDDGYKKDYNKKSSDRYSDKDGYKKDYNKDSKDGYKKDYNKDNKDGYKKDYNKGSKDGYKKDYNKKSSDRYSDKDGYKKDYNKKSSDRYSDKDGYKKDFGKKDKDMDFDKKDVYKKEELYDNSDVLDDEELEEALQLEGRNAVMSALKSDKEIDKIYFKKGEVEGTLRAIRKLALEKNIVCVETSKNSLDAMSKSYNHQGVIAVCPAKEYCEVDDILEYAKQKGEKPFVLILDGITDTYNLGAIIRTAQVCGAHGVIIPKRRSATLNYGVAKASAGAINFVNIAKVTNVTREIEKLQEKGLWIVGTDFDGTSMYDVDFDMPLALVIGSEGDGISNIVKKNCDFIAKIPQVNDEIGSLNASVASAVLMYEVVRQRIKA